MPVWFEDQADKTSHATADKQGNYVLTVHDAWARSPMHKRQPVIWAYASGHQIASANASLALSGKQESVDLTLGPATDTSFLVVGPDGRPAAGAVVEPYRIVAPYAIVPPPAAMLPAIRSVTDETGRARLPAIGRDGFTNVRVTTSSLGEQQLSLRGHASEPAQRQVRLRHCRAHRRPHCRQPAGMDEGCQDLLVDTQSVGSCPALKRRRSRPTLSAAPPTTTEGLAEVFTGDDGTFVVPAIAEGQADVHANVDDALPVRQRPIGDADDSEESNNEARHLPAKGCKSSGVHSSGGFTRAGSQEFRSALYTDLATGRKNHSPTAQVCA